MTYSNDLAFDFNQINKSNLKEAISALYESARAVNDSRWAECNYNHRICYGPRYDDNKYYINLCETKVNAILGASSRVKKIPHFIASGEVDEQTINQYNATYISCSSKFNYESTLMEAKRLATVYGECLIQLFPDYSIDPLSPHPNIRVIPYSRYVTDDQWVKSDMSDASFVITSEYMTKQYASELFPAHKEQIMNASNTFFNNKSIFGQQQIGSHNFRGSLLRVLYLWVRTEEMRHCTYNIHTKEKNFDKIDPEIVKQSYDEGLRLLKYKATVWKQGILIGDEGVYYGPSSFGFEQCPFVACYFERMHEQTSYEPKSRSFVAKIRDAVQVTSRKIIKDNEFLESSNNNILVADKSKLANHTDLFKDDRSQKILFTKGTYDRTIDVLHRVPYQGLSPADLGVTKNDMDILPEVSGVTPDMLGTAPSARVSSLTSAQRLEESQQQFGMVFDRWHNVSRDVGKLVLKFIQSNWEPWQVKREIQQEPTEDFFSYNFGNYSVTLTESEYTDSQRNLVFQQLLELSQYVPNAFPPSLLVSLSNLQNKEQIVPSLQDSEEKNSQMQELKFELEKLQMESEIRLNQANAFKSTELGKERIDRQETDLAKEAELIARAIKLYAESTKIEADAIKSLYETNAAASKINEIKAQQEQDKLEVERKIDERVQENRELVDSENPDLTGQEEPTGEENMYTEAEAGDAFAGG